MSKFNIGDKVKVVRVGQVYTTYPQWAENQKMTNYVGYGLKDNDVGVVIAKAKHTSRVDYDMLYGIELDNGKQFIIGEPGLEIYKEKQMSKFNVGDKVRVTKGGYGVNTDDVGKITTVTSLKCGYNDRVSISIEGFSKQYSYASDNTVSCAIKALELVEAAKPKTPAEQAGFVIGSKYVMIKEDSFMSKGTVVIFVKDDGSRCPYFQNAAIPGKASHGRNSAAFLNLTDMAPYVDFTKPVFTMEGTQVDVVTTTNPRDAKFPVLAYEGKAKTLSKFTIHGIHKRGPARRNLTNDAPKVEVVVKPAPKQAAVYVNLYADGNTGMNRASRAEADRVAGNNPVKRVACKKIVITEGEFDE